MRVLIVDDEPLARLGVRRALVEEPAVEVVGECATGRAALKAIAELAPDLIYLDVQMPGMDAFDVLAQLQRESGPPLVIFTTAYEQYALDAFSFQAVDYLVKPWRGERFKQALERARLIVRASQEDEEREPRSGFRFTVRSAKGIHFVRADRVDWIEAADNYVCLHVGDATHLVRTTIDSLEARLRHESFLRVHRSRMINVRRVARLRRLRHGEFEIVMGSGAVVTSSRAYSASLRELLAGDR